jgi:hypothetical protein
VRFLDEKFCEISHKKRGEELGFFDKLRGKKQDDLGLGGFGADQGSMPDLNAPFGSPDAGFGMSQPAPSMQPMQPMMPSQGMPGQEFNPESSGYDRVPANAPQPYSSQQQNVSEINIGKDLEIISAKLDAIKAELDSMSQRLKRLERMTESENPSFKDKWSY